jgi:uncharacterized iron-regulated membrane protein
MKQRISVVVLATIVALGVGIWMPELGIRRVKAQTTSLSGGYGYQISQPISASNTTLSGAVGVITFDGAGKVSVNQTFVETDGTAGAATVKVQAATVTGTYTVNPDSTGVLSLDLGGASPATFAMVITDSGAGIMLISTGGSNTLTIGTARKL